MALGRGHAFGTARAVQSELSPIVLPLVQAAARANEKAIPFMTAADGVGKRTPVAEVASALSGKMYVEDVDVVEGSATQTYRQLVFADNPSLTQARTRGKWTQSNAKSFDAGLSVLGCIGIASSVEPCCSVHPQNAIAERGETSQVSARRLRCLAHRRRPGHGLHVLRIPRGHGGLPWPCRACPKRNDGGGGPNLSGAKRGGHRARGRAAADVPRHPL